MALKNAKGLRALMVWKAKTFDELTNSGFNEAAGIFKAGLGFLRYCFGHVFTGRDKRSIP